MSSRFKPLPQLPKTQGLEVKYYADVSTDCLTDLDMGLLSDQAAKCLDVASCRAAGVGYCDPPEVALGVVDYLEGFVVWLGRVTGRAEIKERIRSLKEAGFSAGFLDVVRRAMEAGCSTLMFDQDAGPLEPK
jgi:hypothetical protein